MLRYLTAGESHGPALVTIVEGLPAGLAIAAEDVDRHLARRQQGHGRGRRMAIEQDRVRFLGGLRHGHTLGSPLAMAIENRDFARWEDVMRPEGPSVPGRELTRPRPGHADLAGMLKYGRDDARDILERASARETAARVAAGAVAAKLLAEVGVRLASWVVRIGEVAWDRPEALDPAVWAEAAEMSSVRCPDQAVSQVMVTAIDRAKSEGDSLGGVVEVVATGLPPGLGSHVHWDRKLDGRLAAALMSIQSVKAVEIGLGLAAAARRGSEVHDEIVLDEQSRITRMTNRAGGLEGGMTNGMPLVVRAAMKPIATLYRPLASVDLGSGELKRAGVERSDVCAVPSGAVIAEMAVAFELARALLEKAGGDSLAEVTKNLAAYRGEVVRRTQFGPERR